ncbi:hypothetical protein AB0K43_16535 [Kitasatospora sp. NPDC049258]|uniref:hypothetical protein n=1 Tax=Kitasatospora sp. NPDC049258 TaxID=3155394 RepID=UPI0034355ADD
MPGSVTIGHAEALVALSHADAERLATVLRGMSSMLAESGADRLTDAQVTALCPGRPQDRGEFTQWCRDLSEYLKTHL